MTVRRFLVTAPDERRREMWGATAPYANWIERREQTWLVTCFDENAEHFLNAARAVDATVEELYGAGSDERYALLVGEPGSGWGGTR